MGEQRWNLLLVAPKEGHRVAFEQVVEFNKQMMNDSKSLTEGTMQTNWRNETGGSVVPLNVSTNGVLCR